MNIIADLQKLDALVVEHTIPPVTTILRNQLSVITEQAEAYQAASDKQDQTLAAQVITIERLMKENQALKPKSPPQVTIDRGLGGFRNIT